MPRRTVTGIEIACRVARSRPPDCDRGKRREAAPSAGRRTGFAVALGGFVRPFNMLHSAFQLRPGVALVEPWWSLGGALGWPWGRIGVALRWLCGGFGWL